MDCVASACADFSYHSIATPLPCTLEFAILQAHHDASIRRRRRWSFSDAC